MQLINLNIWGGHVRKPLLDFIECYKDVNIFCLQEVYCKASSKISTDNLNVSLDIYSEIQEILQTHHGIFRPTVNGIYGIAMFVKKSIKILEEGEIIIHHNSSYSGTGPTHSRNLQWILCCHNDKLFYIINMHGLWNGKGKTDTQERLDQSQKISDFLQTIYHPTVLCGDFNLRPDTKSIQMLEKSLNNLVKQYKIDSTRTNLYSKIEKFADYIFTSSDIVVENFEVLNYDVSDHAPLLLNFTL